MMVFTCWQLSLVLFSSLLSPQPTYGERLQRQEQSQPTIYVDGDGNVCATQTGDASCPFLDMASALGYASTGTHMVIQPTTYSFDWRQEPSIGPDTHRNLTITCGRGLGAGEHVTFHSSTLSDEALNMEVKGALTLSDSTVEVSEFALQSTRPQGEGGGVADAITVHGCNITATSFRIDSSVTLNITNSTLRYEAFRLDNGWSQNQLDAKIQDSTLTCLSRAGHEASHSAVVVSDGQWSPAVAFANNVVVDCAVPVCSPPQLSINGTTNCLSCPDGTHHVDNDNTCANCSAGSYGIDGVCHRCPLGHFSEWSGTARMCHECPRNHFQNSTGATSCDGCPDMSFAFENSTACLQCPKSFNGDPFVRHRCYVPSDDYYFPVQVVAIAGALGAIFLAMLALWKCWSRANSSQGDDGRSLRRHMDSRDDGL